jgi:hypothetical protein
MVDKRPALGRGLSALIPDAPASPPPSARPLEVDTDLLKPNRFQPRTVMAWHRQRFHEHWRWLSPQGKPGRPAIAKEVRELIRAMWRANPTWGSPRIIGELRKLGIAVAKSTVEKYRGRSRTPPSPSVDSITIMSG